MNTTNKRARHTSPHSKNYVRHIPRWETDKTLCGLQRAKVHCVAYHAEEPTAECMRCQAIRAKAFDESPDHSKLRLVLNGVELRSHTKDNEPDTLAPWRHADNLIK